MCSIGWLSQSPRFIVTQFSKELAWSCLVVGTRLTRLFVGIYYSNFSFTSSGYTLIFQLLFVAMKVPDIISFPIKAEENCFQLPELSGANPAIMLPQCGRICSPPCRSQNVLWSFVDLQLLKVVSIRDCPPAIVSSSLTDECPCPPRTWRINS